MTAKIYPGFISTQAHIRAVRKNDRENSQSFLIQTSIEGWLLLFFLLGTALFARFTSLGSFHTALVCAFLASFLCLFAAGLFSSERGRSGDQCQREDSDGEHFDEFHGAFRVLVYWPYPSSRRCMIGDDWIGLGQL